MIEKYSNLVDKYLNTQAREFAHYDDISKPLGKYCAMECHRRWNGLPISLRNMVYHTLEGLRASLERAPFYKKAMQTMKIKWLGLNLSLPLMLGICEGKY